MALRVSTSLVRAVLSRNVLSAAPTFPLATLTKVSHFLAIGPFFLYHAIRRRIMYESACVA